jgi:transposase
MVKQMSHDEKIQIVTLFKEGLTQIELSQRFNRNESTIKRLLCKFRFSNSVDHSCGNGRPKKLAPSLFSVIMRKIESNPKISLRKVAKSVESDFSAKM